MCDFRKLAHLREQLGDEQWNALISSNNTGRVKAFCDELVKESVFCQQMIVGDRIYDILGVVWGEEQITGNTVIRRADEISANLGEDDAQHLLKHQDEIPVQLRDKVTFTFTNYRIDGYGKSIACIAWKAGQWRLYWGHVDGVWRSGGRILRRVK